MTTAVIVQARMGSSRLPGKVMQTLAGRTVLEHVLSRCAAIPGADVVVCAMPDEAASDALGAVARATGAATFRGSETDVLARYAGAARAVGATIVMRVTSDCPLIDPEICGNVLALRAAGRLDYVANNMPPTFPHGLDCEAMTAMALFEAEAVAQDSYDREHVTPWLRRAPVLRRANLAAEIPDLSGHRWTLDYPEDLEFFRSVFAALPVGSAGHMTDVLALLGRQPHLSNINAMRHQARAAEQPGETK
jgi:spore coat polysaccharide biosynthesis protein SpsF